MEPQEGCDPSHFLAQVERLYGQWRRSVLEQHFAIEAPSPRQLHLRNVDGPGSMSMRQFSGGLILGRGRYCLSQGRHMAASPLTTGIGFSMMVSGYFDLAVPDLLLRERVLPGRMWSRCGTLPTLEADEPGGVWIGGISLDLPPEVLEAWQEDGLLDNASLRAWLDGPPVSPFPHYGDGVARALAETAAQIVAIDDRTAVGSLKMESMALDMLALLLSHGRAGEGPQAPARRSALDEAADILAAELLEPPTITALARRVGMNECYLKARFRQHFGQTIGEYVRTLRMARARGLIEREGCTVQQAAAMVGYTNASHFAAAFRRVHGRAPSEVRRAG